MPTGYTADVGDGKVTDFRTFALRCARAFGATVMQRDNAMDELPKHREESSYYAKSLAEASAEVVRLDALTEDEAQQEMDSETTDTEHHEEDMRLKGRSTRMRYEAMLAEAQEWEPPTPDHAALKTFMEEQLTGSIDFDCHEYTNDRESPADATGWLLAKRAKAAEHLAYSQKTLNEEQERVATANKWIDALYESLAVGGKP